jgi:hypothetical protein
LPDATPIKICLAVRVFPDVTLLSDPEGIHPREGGPCDIGDGFRDWFENLPASVTLFAVFARQERRVYVLHRSDGANDSFMSDFSWNGWKTVVDMSVKVRPWDRAKSIPGFDREPSARELDKAIDQLAQTASERKSIRSGCIWRGYDYEDWVSDEPTEGWKDQSVPFPCDLKRLWNRQAADVIVRGEVEEGAVEHGELQIEEGGGDQVEETSGDQMEATSENQVFGAVRPENEIVVPSAEGLYLMIAADDVANTTTCTLLECFV